MPTSVGLIRGDAPSTLVLGISASPHRPSLCGLGGGFGLRFTLLARHGFFRIVARGAFDHPGCIEKTRYAVRWLRALGEPGLDLVHVELEPCLAILGQQRIEMAETLDEAAVAGKARVGDDDVIDRALLGACACKADDD